MAFKQFSLVGETSTSTGNSALTLAGAIADLRAVGDAHADGDTFVAYIRGISGDADGVWELCLVTYASAGDTVTPSTCYANSNGNTTLIDWGTGTKQIMEAWPGLSDLDATGLGLVTELLAAASTTQKGVVELATAAETNAGSDSARAVTPAVLSAAGLRSFRNLLINPAGRINQRVASSGIADDSYGLDRWYALTQTSTIAVSALTDVEDGLPSMIRLTQSQASAQRMGHAQIIEGKNCKHLRGMNATLSGRIRCSAAQAIRYAILGWTGTEDSVTSDVVNDWTSGTFTAGNFFNSTTLSVLGVGSITPSANTLTDLTDLTAALGSSFNNLIVMIWTEGTIAQNATLDFALQLEEGSAASPREVRPFEVELERCQRYYEKSYELATAPGGGSYNGSVVANPSATSRTRGQAVYRTRKRVTPTVVLYSPYSGDSGKAYNVSTTADIAISTIASGQTGAAVESSATVVVSDRILFQWTADAEL